MFSAKKRLSYYIRTFRFLLLIILAFAFLPLNVSGLEFETDLSLPHSVANHSSYYLDKTLFVFAGSTSVVFNNVLSTLTESGNLLQWNEISAQLPKSLFWYSSAFNEKYVYILGGNEYPWNVVTSVDSVFLGEINDGKISWWNYLTDLPEPIADGFAFIFNNKIYYTGGAKWQGGTINFSSDILYADINEFDHTIGSWHKVGNLPAKMIGHTIVNTGNKLYLIGGYNADLGSSTGDIYEGLVQSDNSIAWSGPITGSFHDSDYRPYHFMSTIIGDTLIVAGGRGPRFEDRNAYDDIYYSHIQDNGDIGLWTESVFTLPTQTCCAGIANDGFNLFIVGGHNPITTEYFDSVWRLSITDITGSPTPTPTVIPPQTPTPTVEPTEQILPLIVFVPGMFASWNSEAILHEKNVPNEKWKIPSYIDVYDNFLKNLESVGYKDKENLWLYAYDWRKDVKDNGLNLKIFIKDEVLKNKPQSTQVVLIGHSMGGLLARLAADDDLISKISKIITFGTPHFGSAKTYPVWEGADFSDFYGLQSILLRSYLRINLTKQSDDLEIIHTLIPSIQNMLPIRNYLKNSNGHEIDWNSMHWKNNISDLLLDRYLIQQNKLYTLGGLGFETVQGYWVEKKSNSNYKKYWIDGKPVEQIFSDDGDGTVLISDAILHEGAGLFQFPNTDHGEIVTKVEPLNKLLEILDISYLDRIDTNSYKHFDKALVVMVGSPVDLRLITPSGSEIIAEDNLILVNDPVPGDYTVRLDPIDSGNFKLYFGRFNKNDQAWDEYAGLSSFDGQPMILKYHVDTESSDLGANPRNNARLRLVNLINNLKQNKQLFIDRAIFVHLENLLKLFDQVDNQKNDYVKTKLLRSVNNYVTNILELVELNSNKHQDLNQQVLILENLRLIRSDINQYISDL